MAAEEPLAFEGAVGVLPVAVQPSLAVSEEA